MKKILIYAFCLIVLSFSIVACGKESAKETDSNKKVGFVMDKNYSYYYDEDGKMVTSKTVKVDESTIYYFGEDGKGVKHTIIPINENLIEINVGIDACFLVLGEDSALLIDTLSGIGNINEVVGLLTDLPVKVILSHAHGDHIGGAFTYDEAYINAADNELFLDNSTDEAFDTRSGYSSNTLMYSGQPANIITENDIQKYKDINILPIEDGQVFDLGGISVEAISVPGHTNGQMSFLFKEMRILLTGDAANTNTMLMKSDKGGCYIEDYRDTITDKLLSRRAEYDKVFTSHGSGNMNTTETTPNLVEDLVEICDGLIDGSLVGVPYQGSTENYIAYETDITTQRLDGGEANIIYSLAYIKR